MRLFRDSKIGKSFIACILLLSIVTVSYAPSPLVHVEKAQAAIDYDPYNTIVNAVSQAYNFITSSAVNALVFKELTLDGIAFALANVAIQQISRSIVTWINNGFQGSPSFVQDLNGFMRDVADITMGNFIEELGLGFLCSPFKLDVIIALDLQYQAARSFELQCTLSDVINNVDGFFSNNSLADGGWQGWFQLTTRPGNNPYGAIVLAEQESAIRIRNAQGEQLTLLDFGRGFLSYQTCDGGDDNSLDVDAVCDITTPGAVIEEQLNEALGFGTDRLIIADEINEIIGALFAQLAQQAFTGVGGLLGLSTQSYSSGGSTYTSYIDAATSVNQTQLGGQNSSENPIQTSIEAEIRYQDTLLRAVSLIDDAELYASTTYGSSCTVPLNSYLTNARNDALMEIAQSDDTILLLQQLLFDFENTNDPNEQQRIFDVYLSLQSSGLLHNEVDIVMYEFQVIGNGQTGITANITTFKQTVDNRCDDSNP